MNKSVENGLYALLFFWMVIAGLAAVLVVLGSVLSMFGAWGLLFTALAVASVAAFLGGASK